MALTHPTDLLSPLFYLILHQFSVEDLITRLGWLMHFLRYLLFPLILCQVAWIWLYKLLQHHDPRTHIMRVRDKIINMIGYWILFLTSQINGISWMLPWLFLPSQPFLGSLPANLPRSDPSYWNTLHMQHIQVCPREEWFYLELGDPCRHLPAVQNHDHIDHIFLHRYLWWYKR